MHSPHYSQLEVQGSCYRRERIELTSLLARVSVHAIRKCSILNLRMHSFM
jgi:hypothetical protein